MPDIENVVALAGLFQITVDELLCVDKSLPQTTEFMYESVTEYDIDYVKHYDIHACWAKEIRVTSTDREKILVRLASNKISSLETDFKVKIDDLKASMWISSKTKRSLEPRPKKGFAFVDSDTGKVHGRCGTGCFHRCPIPRTADRRYL